MRLIDADEIYYDNLLKTGSKEHPLEWAVSHSRIDNIPTIDAVPVKHGHWIGVSQTKFEKLLFPSRVFKCSICENYLDFDGVNAGRGSANYCPNCGAKMDKERNNEL